MRRMKFCCVRGELFNVGDLKTIGPLNLPEGGLLDCAVNEILFGAWQTFQRRRLENDWPQAPPDIPKLRDGINAGDVKTIRFCQFLLLM